MTDNEQNNDSIIKELKAALSGAALGVASMKAAESGDGLTPEQVNKWSRKVNIAVIYLTLVFVAIFSALSCTIITIEQHTKDVFFYLMSPSEKDDFEDRFKNYRVGPLVIESSSHNSKQTKQK